MTPRVVFDGSLLNITHIYNYPNPAVGLKNASGNTGDIFVKDTCTYFKYGSAWFVWYCTSINAG